MTEAKIEAFLASKGYDSKTFYRLCREVRRLCVPVPVDSGEPDAFRVACAGSGAHASSSAQHHAVVLCTGV